MYIQKQIKNILQLQNVLINKTAQIVNKKSIVKVLLPLKDVNLIVVIKFLKLQDTQKMVENNVYIKMVK